MKEKDVGNLVKYLDTAREGKNLWNMKGKEISIEVKILQESGKETR